MIFFIFRVETRLSLFATKKFFNIQAGPNYSFQLTKSSARLYFQKVFQPPPPDNEMVAPLVYRESVGYPEKLLKSIHDKQ